jgi:hypothetical protein
MNILIKSIGLTFFVMQFSTVQSEEVVEFSSTANQTAVVELYTSQGCSSCPPAEKWMNALRDDPGLWSRFIPLAFHVDYWDRLGWPDPYASKQYTERQYQHRRENNISSVYTPGVILSGEEWRGWIRRNRIESNAANVGVLSFKADPQKAIVQYKQGRKNVVLNMVLLGFGMDTKVERGENKNRVLRQEFVVLSHQEIGPGENGQWQVALPNDPIGTASEYALAFWVSGPNNLAPIQSTGYWIPNRWIDGARKITSVDIPDHNDHFQFE